MITTTSSLAIIAVVAAGTFLTRVLPFLVFGGKKKTPSWVTFLGNALPPAIIATLVIYCLKNVDIMEGSHGLPEFIGVMVVGILHIWKKNTLLSIGAGTVVYMFLIQMVF